MGNPSPMRKAIVAACQVEDVEEAEADPPGHRKRKRRKQLKPRDRRFSSWEVLRSLGVYAKKKEPPQNRAPKW